MKEKGYSQRLLPLLSLFVLLQPIIDVFTSFGTRSGHAITVGIVIRTAVMACFFVYVVFFSKGPQRKLCVIYTLLITCYIGVFLGGALLKGGFYAAFGNFKEVIKTFYFNYILVGLFSLYKQYGFTVSDRVLAGTNLLYTGIIFLAFATGSSYYTYPVNKLGYNGWFYAGNEIGVIISILSCISFICFFSGLVYRSKNKRERYVYLGFSVIGILLILFCSTFVGTKTVFIFIMGYLICAFLWNSIVWIKAKKKNNLRYALLLLLSCIVVTASIQIAPIKQIVNDNIDFSQEDPAISPSIPVSPKPSNPSVEENTIKSNQVYKILNKLLSNRLDYSFSSIEQYMEGGIYHQLMGIGYEPLPNFQYDIKNAIEMDFISIFIRHGIIGLVLFVMPLFYLAVLILLFLIRHFKQAISSQRFCTYCYGILVSLAVSFLAGHILVAPAVSIYIAILIVGLFEMTESKEKRIKFNS